MECNKCVVVVYRRNIIYTIYVLREQNLERRSYDSARRLSILYYEFNVKISYSHTYGIIIKPVRRLIVSNIVINIHHTQTTFFVCPKFPRKSLDGLQ